MKRRSFFGALLGLPFLVRTPLRSPARLVSLNEMLKQAYPDRYELIDHGKWVKAYANATACQPVLPLQIVGESRAPEVTDWR